MAGISGLKTGPGMVSWQMTGYRRPLPIPVIGERALFGKMIYGLVAPGDKMAEVVATRLCGGDMGLVPRDWSTKLKLPCVNVAVSVILSA